MVWQINVPYVHFILRCILLSANKMSTNQVWSHLTTHTEAVVFFFCFCFVVLFFPCHMPLNWEMSFSSFKVENLTDLSDLWGTLYDSHSHFRNSWSSQMEIVHLNMAREICNKSPCYQNFLCSIFKSMWTCLFSPCYFAG